MERSRTEHAEELAQAEQASSRVEAQIALEIAARADAEARLAAAEEEVGSLRKCHG